MRDDRESLELSRHGSVDPTRSTEAPDILDEGKFDVVFLDLHVPSPDGIELARQMRSSRFHRTTSIVPISDDQRPSALSVGFVAGASFFLYKSIDKDRLLKLVRATQGAMAHERPPGSGSPDRSGWLILRYLPAAL